MSKQTGIWIDTSKAVIVNLKDGKVKTFELESEVENKVYHKAEGNKGTFSGNHHGNSETKFEARIEQQLNHFLKDIVSLVKESDELYVFGPAETKVKLEKKIRNDKTCDSSKLKAVETVDSMTLNEIIAKVKKFYHPESFL